MAPRQTTWDMNGLATRDPVWVRRVATALKPLLWTWFRPEVRGLDRVPAGAAVLAANHNAALLMPDLFILGIALYERFGLDGLPYGMGHRTGVGLPWLHDLLVPLGAMRGTQDNGSRALQAGAKVLVYPGGELDSMRSWGARHRVVFGSRRGYIRLALREGVPIVPVVTAGAHESLIVLNNGRRLARWLGLDRRFGLYSWPLVLCLPWGLWPGVPPPHLPWPTKILMEVLEPVTFARTGRAASEDVLYVEECHRQVHGAMESTLARLGAERTEKRVNP